ncbi:unnamed protein product [Euphydryas editha]|uniref:Uncharacterized protein n=1 Tax=Euphydryas editha TaxID=104508 RepID=A0AAU9U5R6_EUPED|nr:unnamed protein product [Euphydryas editha]
MKSVYCVYIFIHLLLLSCDASGGLVKGVLEKIHETAHKIHETAHKIHDDVHKVFHPTEEPKYQPTAVIDVRINENDNDDLSVFATTPTAVPVPTAVNREINTGVDVNKNLIPTEDISKVVFASIPATAEAGTSTTTEKDGRESFTGGCITGYEKTKDGRCESIFK